MALSNVRSSEYRAAGGRQWHRTKSKAFITYDGPVPEWVVGERQKNDDAADRYYKEKARIREQLSQGYDERLVKVVPEGKRARRKAA